jgi:hypothetical protein
MQFLDFLTRHNADTLLNCLLQAEAVKNHSPDPPDYTLFQKTISPWGAIYSIYD